MPNMDKNKTEYHKITYGSQVIAFELEYKNRRTLEISVFPDLTVKVKAPLQRSYPEIEEKVRKRATWIIEQKYFFSLFLPKQPPKKYISGETHLYLGRQYRLKVIPANEDNVVLSRGLLTVFTKDRMNSPKIQTLVERWYHNRAREKFQERIHWCYEKVRKYGINRVEFQVRNMSKRWGSCSKAGKLLLNYQLIKAPSHCIDYVILHELCHVKYFNHGKIFYHLLTQVMPDWEKRKKRLEQISV